MEQDSNFLVYSNYSIVKLIQSNHLHPIDFIV